jgi:hypothetical protein
LFLEAPEQPIGIDDQGFKRFIRKASDFFMLDGQLWKKDQLGKHKLVIPEDRRLGLIRQVHNDLGHKGIYTVRTRLLEQFCWPDLEEDVKWCKTCHECQIWLIKKVIIPATVPTPAGLFRKVYIDTMLMPKAQGYRYIIHARCSLISYLECSTFYP